MPLRRDVAEYVAVMVHLKLFPAVHSDMEMVTRLALDRNDLTVRGDNDPQTLVVVAHTDMAGTFDTDDDTAALGVRTADYSMVNGVAQPDSRHMQHETVVAIQRVVDHRAASESDLAREEIVLEQRVTWPAALIAAQVT